MCESPSRSNGAGDRQTRDITLLIELLNKLLGQSFLAPKQMLTACDIKQ